MKYARLATSSCVGSRVSCEAYAAAAFLRTGASVVGGRTTREIDAGAADTARRLGVAAGRVARLRAGAIPVSAGGARGVGVAVGGGGFERRSRAVSTAARGVRALALPWFTGAALGAAGVVFGAFFVIDPHLFPRMSWTGARHPAPKLGARLQRRTVIRFFSLPRPRYTLRRPTRSEGVSL